MNTDEVVIKESLIDGKGIFASRNFKQGEVILHWDTTQVIDKSELKKLDEEEKKYITLVNGQYTKMQEPEKFVNHSYNPDTYVKNFCDVALRDISEGEEITSDYTDSLPPNTVIPCNCGSKRCRKVITNMKFLLQQSDFAAIPSQTERLDERHQTSEPMEIVCCGLPIQVLSGVYKTSADTELMADTVKIELHQTFLEIGCGTGIVCISLAKKAKSGVGVDINKLAVENSKLNFARHSSINNVEFLESNLFENVQGQFDVIICNPPYNNNNAKDNIDKMFWDAKDDMKQRFFKEVGNYLKENGRIYFGWANFADLDLYLPFRLAEENGFEVVDVQSRPSKSKNCLFYVFEFRRK